MNSKEFTKKVARVLRKEGINTKNLKGNGTTAPDGYDTCDAYFVWEGKEERENEKLFLNFTMDRKICNKIKSVFYKYEIPYSWNGSKASCFQLVAYNLEVKQ